MSDVVVPDRVGVEIGWRAWAVADGMLKSPQLQVAWLPREEARATCAASHPRSDIHAAPAADCRCGLYAMRAVKDLDFSFSYRRVGEAHVWYGDPAVVGCVKLWGKVIPGTHGWRAEYAYPAGLVAIAEEGRPRWYAARELVEELARLYGVGLAVKGPDAAIAA
jgi:hypothetical protein